VSRPTRDQVLAGVVAVAGRVGVARLTVDEVAREAGVGRATVYRWFPGGREQLVDEGITWEIGRFLDRVAEATAGAPDLRSRLVGTIRVARRLLAEHEVLQRLLATEPGGVLPQLQQTVPLVVAVLRDDLRTAVAAEPRRRAGVDPEEAADWLARMVLSFTIAEGRHDLDDDAELEHLVDDVLLAGLLEPTAPEDRDHA
jgi:AcrR family transcriptional regulator